MYSPLKCAMYGKNTTLLRASTSPTTTTRVMSGRLYIFFSNPHSLVPDEAKGEDRRCTASNDGKYQLHFRNLVLEDVFEYKEYNS